MFSSTGVRPRCTTTGGTSRPTGYESRHFSPCRLGPSLEKCQEIRGSWDMTVSNYITVDRILCTKFIGGGRRLYYLDSLFLTVHYVDNDQKIEIF